MRKVPAALLALAVIFLLLLPFVGCNRETYFKSYGLNRDDLLYETTPREDEAFALNSVDLLRQGRFDQVEDQLDPSIRNAQIRDSLTRMHDVFPGAQPASIKTVEAGSVRSRNGFTTHITLEYEFAPQIMPTSGRTELMPRSWRLAQVVILRSDGARTIRGLRCHPDFEVLRGDERIHLCGQRHFSVCRTIACPRGRLDYFIRPRAVHPFHDRQEKVVLVDPDVGWHVPRYRELD